jgi:hypothetical protein
MLKTRQAVGGLAIGLVILGAAIPGLARADFTVRIVGTEASGAGMQARCDLRPLSPPSNSFLGGCELTIGGERLAVSGLDVDGKPVLSAVLDGRITVRGLAATGSERFVKLVSDGAAGFPVYLHIDPFGRAWALEADLPGGGRARVEGGSISAGSVGLAIE